MKFTPLAADVAETVDIPPPRIEFVPIIHPHEFDVDSQNVIPPVRNQIIDRRMKWFLFVAAVAAVPALLWISANVSRPRKTAVQPAKSTAKRSEVPSESRVYSRCCEMVLVTLKNPDTAEISDNGTVERLTSETNPRWRVNGRVRAENTFGNKINGTWEMEVEWNEKTDKFEPDYIQLGDTYVYRSPQFEKMFRLMSYAIGNEASDIPADIAKEIRNVQAAVDDAIKFNFVRTFTPQWPDDPARHEFKIHINREDLWEVHGKLATYDDRPRRVLFATVAKDTYRVMRLRIDDKLLIDDGERVSK